MTIRNNNRRRLPQTRAPIVGALLLALVFLTSGVTSLQAQDTLTRRTLAELRADITVLNENMHKLNAANKTLVEQNRALRKRVETLRARLGTLAEENKRHENSLRELREQLRAERAARETMGERLVETVSAEVERLLQQVSGDNTGSGGASSSNLPIRGQYTVQTGDTLSAIATAFDTTVAKLKQANNLSSDIIRTGQVLDIPAQ